MIKPVLATSSEKSKELARAILLAISGGDAIDLATTPIVIGVRGWDGSNNRGVYDDACFVINKGEVVGSFNFNTDPCIFRPQMAVLQEGIYDYMIGIHGLHHIKDDDTGDRHALSWLYANVGKDHPNAAYRLTYWALRQAGPVTVLRDGKSVPETAGTGDAINIHRGGINGTSSEGCQTVENSQFAQFRDLVYGIIGPVAGRKIKYALRVLKPNVPNELGIAVT